MTDQQQPPNLPLISPDEVTDRWGRLLNQAFIQIISLENQLAEQAVLIEKITANELRLSAKLAEFYRKSKNELSPEVEALAAEAEAIANAMPEAEEGEKEKAAPIEAAEFHPILDS